MENDDKLMARRQWLRSVARYVSLGGIGLVAWSLLSRCGGACFRLTLPCQECELLAHCRRPRARQAKGPRKNGKTTP